MTGDVATAFRQRLETWIAALTFEEKSLVLDWVEKALASPDDEDHIDRGLLEGCINGDVEISVRAGEVMFGLTAQGHDRVGQLLLSSLEARHSLKSIAGGAAVDEPKDPQ